MQKKLNEDFIEEYSEQFAAKISDDFFSQKDHISGQEILGISPSKQVNFFVIKLLFNNWQEESNRLESPFFDYSAPEVKEAMVQFMNVLSRHIKVGRKEFEHLLQDAVRDTLFLLMDPNGFMEIEMDRRGNETLTEKSVKNILKYLRVQKEAFADYLNAHIGTDRDDISLSEDMIPEAVVNEELALLNEVMVISLNDLWDDETDETEEVLRVDEDDVFKPAPKPAARQEEPPMEESLPAPETEPEDAAATDQLIEEKSEVAWEVPAPEQDQEDGREDEDDIEEDEDADDEEEGEDKEDDDEDEPEDEDDRDDDDEREEDEDLEDQEEKEEESLLPKSVITNIPADEEDEEEEDVEDILNAKFENPAAGESVNKAHEQVDSMMSAISVNQRYMFINELFDGDPEVFRESVEKVDACASFDESVEMLVQNYAREYHWDMNSEEVKELLKIIFRRFR